MGASSVPRYGGPRVATSPLPNIRVPVDVPREALGAPVQSDLSPLANDLLEEARKEGQRANESAVTEAEGKLSKLEADSLYGPDGQGGLLSAEGRDALGAKDKMLEGWKKGVDEIEKGLTNDIQRAAFRRSVVNRFGSLYNTATQHVAGQIKQHDNDVSSSYITNETNAAIAAAGVKGASVTDVADRTSTAEQRIRAVYADVAKRNSWSDEKRDEMVSKDISKLHSMVLDRMIAQGNDLSAQQYHEAVKDKIIGQDAVSTDRSLKESSVRGESQKQSDAIMTKFAGNEKGAMDAVKAIKDPDVRDAVRERVEHEFNVQKTQEANDKEQAFLQAGNFVDNNRGRPARQVVPANIWAKLDIHQRDALERRHSAPADNDDSNWLNFISLSPVELGTMNKGDYETKYRAGFDEVHRERADAMWDQAVRAQKMGRYDAPKLASTISFQQRITNALHGAGMMGTDKTLASTKLTKDESRTAANFETEASRRIQEYEVTNLKGLRPATGEEQQQIIDSLMRERVYLPQRMGADKGFQPQAVAIGDRQRAYVPLRSIPPADHQSLASILRNAGRTVSVDKIQRMYAAKLMNDRQLFDQIMQEK